MKYVVNFNKVMSILKNIDIEKNKNKILKISYSLNSKNSKTVIEINNELKELIRKTILFYSDEDVEFKKISIDKKIIYRLPLKKGEAA